MTLDPRLVHPGEASADLESLEGQLIAQWESSAELGRQAVHDDNRYKREFHKALLKVEGKNAEQREANTLATQADLEDGTPWTVGELGDIARLSAATHRSQNDAILVTRTQIDIRRTQIANERALS